MRLIGLSVIFGLPGFLLGLALGVVIRRWAALLVVVVAGAVAARYGVRELGNGPGDNDPSVIWVVAVVANFIGFVLGIGLTRLLGGLRQR
jgi:hypothetical protein